LLRSIRELKEEVWDFKEKAKQLLIGEAFLLQCYSHDAKNKKYDEKLDLIEVKPRIQF
jgi:hypothetical protein